MFMRKPARWLTALTKLAVVFGVASLSLLGWSQQGPQTHTVCRQGCTFDSIQAAVDAAQRDDVVSIEEGVYREFVTITKALTLEAAPLFPASEDFAYVLIVNPEMAEPQPTLLVCNAGQVRLRGLKVTHNSIPPGAAIGLEPGPKETWSQVTLDHIHTFGVRDGGVHLGRGTVNLPGECEARTGYGGVDVWIKDSLLSDNALAGVYVEGTFGEGSSLTLQTVSLIGNGMGIGSLSGDAQLSRLTVYNSLFADNTAGGLSGYGGLRSLSLVLEDNVFLHNGSLDASIPERAVGLYVHANNATLRGNLVLDNYGAGIAIHPDTRQVTMAYNRVERNLTCGLLLLDFDANETTPPQILGRGNTFSANHPNDICPSDIALEADFQLDTLELALNQTRSLPEGLAITFERVLSDSRCPLNVVCEWAGDAAVQISVVQQGKAPQTLTLHSTLEPGEVVYEGFAIRYEDLSPKPFVDQPIHPESYRLTLSIGA